jgi:DNA-binding transcriptional MerR regulator
MNFVEEVNLPQDVQPVQEDQPVNVGVRLKKLKTTDSNTTADDQADTGAQMHFEPAVDTVADEPSVNMPIADPVLKLRSGRGRKSIRQISEEADLIQIPEDEVLFLKQYYTMGEVAEMFRVNQSLLRFWEAEFSILQPKKNKKGDRYFRPVDIKNLHLIYHLLRQRKYTIEGAKDFLRKNSKAEEKFETIKKLEEVKRFLLEMKASLL